jgi:pantoate--beta-alanine ligase
MRVVEHVADVRAMVGDARRAGQRIGFVPTMGYLHDGHLALVAEARRRAGLVVMSIFVNPLQFGPTEDFSRYPRDPDGDATKARGAGVDLLFVPETREMYDGTPEVVVAPRGLADLWEGSIRPGHFEGVLTVVAKLFNIVQPDVTVFGQKDIQQATVVAAMIRALDIPVELVVATTVREPDGLAMSSRNAYLRGDDRSRARALSRALATVERLWRQGERDPGRLESAGRGVIAAAGAITVDYLALVDPATLRPVRDAARGTIVMTAARVGPTRLIDNIILGDDSVAAYAAGPASSG